MNIDLFIAATMQSFAHFTRFANVSIMLQIGYAKKPLKHFKQIAVRSRGGNPAQSRIPCIFYAPEKSSIVAHARVFSFPQACRGSQLDKGVKIIHETDSKSTTYSIPTYADIMVAYSTYDGMYMHVIHKYKSVQEVSK